MQTDASLLGWRTHLQGMRTGGKWTADEAISHTTNLEMKKAFTEIEWVVASQQNVTIWQDKFGCGGKYFPIQTEDNLK